MDINNNSEQEISEQPIEEQTVEEEPVEQGQPEQQTEPQQEEQDDWDPQWFMHTKWWLVIIACVFVFIFAAKILLPALEPTEHKPSDLLTPHGYEGNMLDDLMEGGDDLLNGE